MGTFFLIFGSWIVLAVALLLPAVCGAEHAGESAAFLKGGAFGHQKRLRLMIPLLFLARLQAPHSSRNSLAPSRFGIQSKYVPKDLPDGRGFEISDLASDVPMRV